MHYHIVIPGRPISKSNLKLMSKTGRVITPRTGAYAKYAIYEDDICQAIFDQLGYPPPVITGRCLAVLTFVYPNHAKPDLTNAPKSLCDGLEKSALIINDRQLGPQIMLKERIDKADPHAELDLYPADEFEFRLDIIPRVR